MSEDIEFTVTKPLTELQLTKDSSIQSIPLTNETYINTNEVECVTRFGGQARWN